MNQNAKLFLETLVDDIDYEKLIGDMELWEHSLTWTANDYAEGLVENHCLSEEAQEYLSERIIDEIDEYYKFRKNINPWEK